MANEHPYKFPEKDQVKLSQIEPVQSQENSEELARLRHELQFYKTLYQTVPFPYFILNKFGKIISLNLCGISQLGYEYSELKNQLIFKIIHPEDRQNFQSNLTELIENPTRSKQWESRQICKNNRVLWVKFTARAISEGNINSEENLLSLGCEAMSDRALAEAALQKARQELEQAVEKRTAELTQANTLLKQEIAERQRAEEKIEKFAALVENSRDFIAISSLEGDILFVNEAGQKLVGLENIEVALSQPMSEYFSPQGWQQFMQVTLPGMLNQGHWEGEGQLRHFKTGQLIDVHRSCFVVKHPHSGEPFCLATVQRDITERKQAEKALRRQREREQLMAAIATRIRQSLQLDEILQTTVEEVRQFLATDRVFIYGFEPDWSGVILLESVGAEWQSVLGTRIKDCCFAETYVEPYKNGRIQATSDIYTAGLSPCHIQLLERLQVRANLVVPILQIPPNYQLQSTNSEPASSALSIPEETRLWGLMVVNHCRDARQWQPLEIDLLQQLATQVAIAIQQSHLYQQVQLLNVDLERQVQERTVQLQRSLEFEAMLKRITDKVRDSLDENQILQTVVQELTVVLGIDGCDTALYDLSEQTAIISYECTPRVPSAQGYVMEMANFPEGYRQLLKGEFFQFCQMQPHLRGHISILSCPIFDDQGVLGDLWLFKPLYEVFHELEIRLVQQVANQCAIAIRQARLFQASLAQVQELEKLNLLKDDFLSTVSHELRTPISNIKIATQMLEIIFKNLVDFPDGDHFDRYLKILQDESDREISLINDLLDLQQLEAGTQPLILCPIDLQDWILHIVEPFQEITTNQQQRLYLNIPATLPALISDRSSLGRLLSELLTNAAKYTPRGGEISVNAVVESEKLYIRIQNTGVEIPDSEKSQIFNKFYRIPSADPWKQGGTGLGLALAKKLAEHLGGKIWVETGRNFTCFVIELPLNLAG